MRVCLFSTLFWLAHILFLAPINGENVEEVYKPRRWSSAGEGPYRLIVSSEAETLDREESVSLAAAQVKKERDKSSNDDFDKITERINLKRARKREPLPLEDLNPRKRRRNPTSSTTGLPQTMSYNLYNHFRPLEQDVPQDHLLPFLDFGKKLSTTSGHEGSSTPKVEERDEDDVFHEDMDVTVMKKAVERNSVPRGPIQLKPTHIASFFSSNSSDSSALVNKTALNLNDDCLNIHNKTDKKDVHYDLQSNESGIKLHTVLSPNYGLKLNRTEKVIPNRTNSFVESKEISSTTETVNITSSEKVLPEKDATVSNSSDILLEPKSKNITPVLKPNIEYSGHNNAPSPLSSPKPTARILSTAVVTSVSIKETLPRLPRLKPNITRPENFQRLLLKNATGEALSHLPHINLEPRIRLDNHTLIGLHNARRKLYTTLRPKTTTYRPVTFRSVFRRNTTGLGSGVVHIVSTPPTYIEVPKIITNSPVVRLANIDTKLSAFTSRVHPPISTTAGAATTNGRRSTTTATSTTPFSIAPTTFTTRLITRRTTSTSPTTIFTMTPKLTTSTTTTPSSPPMTNGFITTEGFQGDYPMQTELGILEDFTGEVENATVHIEFKPLDPFQASSTTESYGKDLGKRPSLLWIYNQRNHSTLRTQSVGVAYPESVGLVTYVLAVLALIPLILGLSVLVRQILRKSKKKVLDESEYSSEYNRTPLPTKLPRVPSHINWEAEKPTSHTNQAVVVAPVIPVTKWEFSRDKLRLQTVLGQGNFGQVWKAEADDLNGHEGSTRLVAVKTVKEGASLREKEDLLRELGIMQELGAHPNVVTLLGCCTEKEPYLVIMEYVMYGKLLAFLREHRSRAHYFNFSDLSSALTSRDLTVFAYCVARGMEYLVTKGIIHRDLAARNILVDHTKLCKIADFGMSRNVRDTGQIYEQRPNRGALPIRWMAPESLHLSLFTHKSDVWSFGILMWEIVTLGSTPYNKMGAREVMRQVREGYRLEKPKHCRPELYKVITKCWHTDPGKRPSFTDLKQDLAALLANEESNGEYVDLEALTEEMCDQNN